MDGILRKKGYSPDDAEALSILRAKNKEFWLDIKVREELGIDIPNGNEKPLHAALATLGAFVAAGAAPLSPYLFIASGQDTFLFAVVFTAVVLFTVGAVRSRFTGRHWVIAGLEMLCIGGIAAGIAYSVGYAASAFMGRAT